MHTDRELETLQLRLEELEARNRELESAAPRRSGRVRNIFASVLITLSIVLAPISAVTAWVASQLLDTDRFVQTFAPLAHSPEIQGYLANQVSGAIDEALDVDAIVAEVFTGITALDLPPRAGAALQLLEAPAAAGLRSIIDSSIASLVTSPQFAHLWEGVLRESHSRAIALIQGDPAGVVQLGDDGTISLSVGNLISEVKEVLTSRGFDLAAQIPEIERSIPIMTVESLLPVRTGYQLGAALGIWLPWAVIGIFVIGVALARRRVRAVALGGLGVSIAFAALALALWVGGRFFVASVSPNLLPSATAQAFFDQLSSQLFSIAFFLVAVGLLVAIGLWFVMRTGAASQFAAAISARAPQTRTSRTRARNISEP